jgi:hypothetical protein
MTRLKIFSLIALLAGPVIFGFAHNKETEKKLIDREGVAVEAIPLAKIEKRGRRGSKSYKLEVEYPVEALGKFKAEIGVSKALYERAETEPVIKIKYLASAPEKVIVVGEPTDETEGKLVAAAVFLFGIGGTWWNFFRKKPAGPPEMPAAA